MSNPLNHSRHTWTISDGHAGNVRQTRALARALALPVAREWTLRPHRLARWLAPRLWPGAQGGFGPDFEQALAAPPAIAIGCGRQAALATRLLRFSGARQQSQTGPCSTIQILDPRISPRHWDLVITPEHDRLHGANVVTVLGSLNPVDDAWLAQARIEFADMGTLPGPRVAVLVGGPTRHAPLQRDALLPALRGLTERVREAGGSLLLSASRRTPDDWAAPLRDMSARITGRAWFDTSDGLNPYPGLLAWADAIVCTPDSVNMLSEACATRVPVYAIDPDRVQGRPARFIAALRERGRVHPLLDPQAPVHPSVAAEPLRETARAADEATQRLGLQRVEKAGPR